MKEIEEEDEKSRDRGKRRGSTMKEVEDKEVRNV